MDHQDLVDALDGALWELGEALEGMPDADLWTRPDPRLLSVGELAMHMAGGEVDSFFGGELETPLVAGGKNYYPYSVASPVALPMGAAEVHAEVKRVHAACRAKFLSEKPDLQSKNPHRPDWTWAYTLQYMAFHFAYHTGQIYSVRHLLGHETVDN